MFLSGHQLAASPAIADQPTKALSTTYSTYSITRGMLLSGKVSMNIINANPCESANFFKMFECH